MATNLRISPKQMLSKALIRSRPLQSEISKFKENLLNLIFHVNDSESEEFHKNLVRDFLNHTYFNPAYFVNTKGFNDLVIHLGPCANDPVGVILEAKKPTNSFEMPSEDCLDSKAFQELVLYYMRERFEKNNLQIKHLICTNIYQWFIFDVKDFERNFAQNINFVQSYKNFSTGKLADGRTMFFYKEIASPAIKAVQSTIRYAFFDIQNINNALSSLSDDAQLIQLYKLLSPQHLLKLSFDNDSNTLDKGFYAELLHIIGLEEVNDGGKNLIIRKIQTQRDTGSLIENAILQIDSLDKLDDFQGIKNYGNNNDDQLFNISLELSITWINRILFLKLLEAQLLAFHNNDLCYAFLKPDNVHTFNSLNNLFFQVLAKHPNERGIQLKTQFEKVPYLNSSLFEPIEIEKQTISIGALSDNNSIKIFTSTILIDENGQRLTGTMLPVPYLLKFLGSFDFTAEFKEKIQEDNKRLINASVLGLIFEKINGYKDGSFFTPGFVTMQICRETINRGIINKFNQVKGWHCLSIEDIYDKIEDRAEANIIFNSLRICDPSVGSGHFLVSALNEMIALKSRLHILCDNTGKRLKEYSVDIQADELIITDDDGEYFNYKPKCSESQRVQEAIFNEKKSIIESCLFGVDINPNSVKICRLRLWIELLKHAYYRNDGYLETLPNIDINIKQGNSVISRFLLDEDLSIAIKKCNYTVEGYRGAVSSYRNSKSKEQKRSMDRIINEIKEGFRTEILNSGSLAMRTNKATDEFNTLNSQLVLFEESAAEKNARKKTLDKLHALAISLQSKLDYKRSGKIFEGSFEWRFEFPEVLDENGNFEGFDVIIANPPYIDSEKMINDGQSHVREHISGIWSCAKGNWDLYIIFMELGLRLLNKFGTMAFITPDKWISKSFGDAFRLLYFENIQEVTALGRDVFDSALVDSIVTLFSKNSTNQIRASKLEHDVFTQLQKINKSDINPPYNLDLLFSSHYSFIRKLESNNPRLGSLILADSACATSDAYKLKPLVFNADGQFSSENYLRLVNTGTLSKYFTKWGIKPITYLGLKLLEPVVDKSEFVNHFKKTYKTNALAKKIIVKGLTLLDAALDLDGKMIPGKTTLILRSDDEDLLKFTVAVLNCPTSIFYIKAKYSSSSYNGGINFTKDMLNSLPIPNGTEIRIKVVNLVDDLYARIKVDCNINVDNIIHSINHIIYSGFGLNEDEISMIEGVVTIQNIDTIKDE